MVHATAEPATVSPPESRGPAPRRWWMLAALGLAQLMVVLDATIVNIALPSAQHALGFSNIDRQWVSSTGSSGSKARSTAARSLPQTSPSPTSCSSPLATAAPLRALRR
jgi:hypothetical protein